ncbi:MAG: carbohydrate kinase family protein [Treponema sp.]|jgi:sugar/nucleoside kinase (ribokinase family)|nr:carbohydrate kinase family protein [Treponema sp.]
MDKRLDIIGIENLIMDFAYLINKIPVTDSFSTLEDYLWQSGGNVSSAIVAASRLGAICGMIGMVGDDPFGDFCVNDMKMHNVDVSHIRISPKSSTTFCICLAEKSTFGRSFLGNRGTHMDITNDMIDEEFVASARYLHIGVHTQLPILTAVDMARKNGVIVSMDAGGYTPDSEKLIPKIDILIMSEMYYDKLFTTKDYKKNCAELLKKGPGIVIVTLGKHGCAGADASGTFEMDALGGQTDIIDTTGAGDVFHGGFLYSHLQGWDTKTCARFASAVSYIDCTCLGGRTGIPTRKTVEKFLETGIVDKTDAKARMEYYRTAMFKSIH